MNVPQLALRSLLILVLGTGAAQASTLIDASNPQQVLEIAKGFGSAELGTDDVGDPNIVGRIDGTKYGVYFYGCKNGRDCTALQFSAGWSGVATNLTEINAWNRDNRFAKAFLDNDGDPRLEMDINADHGITRDNLEDSFEWWQVCLQQFNAQVLQ